MFKKNHFIFPYFGNKRTEVQHIDFIHDKDKMENITTIIEPYAGSSAFSYYVSLLYPNKYKYVLNDNDENLIKLYKIMKDEKLINEFDKLINDIINKFNSYDNDKDRKQFYLSIDDDYGKWFFYHKYYNIRYGLYPNISKINKIKKFSLKDCDIYNFIKNEDVELLNDDAINIYEKYNNSNKNVIFLDPPYLNSCNLYYYYNDAKVNIFEYLYNNNIKNYNSKIILILENIWIIKLLFNENYDKKEYDKKYNSKNSKLTKHIIISN